MQNHSIYLLTFISLHINIAFICIGLFYFLIFFFYLQVTQDEWCAMWDEFSKNPSAPQEWQTHYMNFMFDLVDTSGNNYF